MIKEERGLTLMELIVAVFLIGIGIIAAAGAFKGIHQAIQFSKGRTLANNIAQEKMQILMQKSYYEVIVTTAPAYLTIGGTTIGYDNSVFPPETLVEGGGNYTRYTLVQAIQADSGLIQVLNDPLTPDTGIRQITVTVVWNSLSGQKFIQVKSVLNNPNTVMASTWLKGVVMDSTTHATISGAVVDAAENVGWRDTADATGNYSINLVPGTFNFVASDPGYYPSIIPVLVQFNSVTNQPFYLQAIATGTIRGTAWINNHLLISQVVAATGTVAGGGGINQDIEYVELYNPTTSSILLGTQAGMATPSITLVFWDSTNNGYVRQWHYTSAIGSVPAHGYYLVSNTGTGGSPATGCNAFTVTGTLHTPDACWAYVIAPAHAFECGAAGCSGATTPDAGGISLANSNSYTVVPGPVNLANWPAAMIDSVGWSDTFTGNPAPSHAVEPSSGIGLIRPNGLPAGDQFVRHADTTTIIGTNGRAYDSNNNVNDFLINSPLVGGPNSSTTIQIPVAGSPAYGAIVSITDGLSAPSSATVTGSPPYALFVIPGVATGTWTAFIDSNTYSAEIDSITIVANSTTSIPNAATSPSWAAANEYATILSTNGTLGIINGHVTDDVGIPIPGGITVAAGSTSTVTGLGGSYSLRIATGTYDVTANPNNANGSYSYQVQTGVAITLGDTTQPVNFQLSKTGKIRGWITRDGVNPLPGVDVVALDSFGSAHDTEPSGNNGQFTLINLTTGVYTVQPILDPKETSAPISSTITVTAGTTVTIGTFTILGAMGQVQGNVSVSSQPIKSGVLIVISTAPLSLPLPAISSSSLTTSAIYSDSSKEDGTYSVDVRGSTTSVYNVYGLYMYLNNQTPVISTRTITNVTVTAGQATTGKNLTW